MGILSGNPKDEPLHYGEVFDIWSVSIKAKGCVSVYRAYQYHAGDKELKKILGDLINQAELESEESDQILVQNGIAPSPTLPARPEAKLEDIPVGARLTDQEIASLIAADNAASLAACSMVMGKSIREDIGALFGKYHATKAALGLKILEMNKEKGWLVPPPLQVKRPELVEA
ncbi:MAG: rane protein [Paenibacillus sp.]|nr:rane protein [Paenibacillus sp.]